MQRAGTAAAAGSWESPQLHKRVLLEPVCTPHAGNVDGEGGITQSHSPLVGLLQPLSRAADGSALLHLCCSITSEPVGHGAVP